MNMEFQNLNEIVMENGSKLSGMERSSEILEDVKDISFQGLEEVSKMAVKISYFPSMRKFINEKIDELKSTVHEVGENVISSVKTFIKRREIEENVHDLPNPSTIQFPYSAKFNEGAVEGREFGLIECTNVALRIFNPGVIVKWEMFPKEMRAGIALEYAEEASKALQLQSYKGVIIEKLEPGCNGFINGDGVIHISEQLVSSKESPMQILDTITHELRHQYQRECIQGFHDVPNEVRVEWNVAQKLYNYNNPSCYDPWGYKYNPLEIDARYAGNTVVRNVTNQLFNEIANT